MKECRVANSCLLTFAVNLEKLLLFISKYVYLTFSNDGFSLDELFPEWWQTTEITPFRPYARGRDQQNVECLESRMARQRVVMPWWVLAQSSQSYQWIAS